LATSAVATVLLSANHYFWLHTGGYFDAPNDSFPLLHTWTLSVEEQFYLVWPWLILAIGAWSRYRGIRPQRTAMALLAAVFVMSLVACVFVTRDRPQVAFFLMPFRAWEFAAGGAVVLLLRWRRPIGFMSETIAVVGLIAVFTAIATFRADMAFPGWIALLPVLGSAALIYGSEAHPQGTTARFLSLKPMVLIGLISYSLYLWHWPVLSIAGIALVGQPAMGERIALCAAAMLLAWLTYRYIEQPIRSRRVSFMATRPRTFRVGAGLMVCIVVTALGLGVWAKFLWPTLPGNADKAARIVAMRKPDWSCEKGRQVLSADGGNRGCLVGNGGEVRILLWGDSHAGELKPVLATLANARGVSALLRYQPKCPPAIEFETSGLNSEPEKCLSFNRDVLADVRTRPALDTVILNARWIDQSKQVDRLPLLTASLKRTVAALQASGVRVALVAPGVEFPRRVPECLMRRDEASCELSRSDAFEQRAAAMSVIDSVVLAYPDVVVIDPLVVLCPNSRCPVRKGKDVLYSDRNHLSMAGAKLLTPAFLAAQERLLAAKRP
jgi:peptidoglycan/LPS O-acetylase OafA/YrhL